MATKAMRDLTQKQFNDACKRHVFIPQGFMGYYQLGGTSTSVSIHNAGTNRRAQLAYLIREHEKARTEMNKRQAAKDQSTC